MSEVKKGCGKAGYNVRSHALPAGAYCCRKSGPARHLKNAYALVGFKSAAPDYLLPAGVPQESCASEFASIVSADPDPAPYFPSIELRDATAEFEASKVEADTAFLSVRSIVLKGIRAKLRHPPTSPWAYFAVNGVLHKTQNRGWNVMVVSLTGTIVGTMKNFDSYHGPAKEGAASQALKAAIDGAPANHYVLVGTYDWVAFGRVASDVEAAKQALKSIGASSCVDGMPRAGRLPYALIGFKGSSSGTVRPPTVPQEQCGDVTGWKSYFASASVGRPTTKTTTMTTVGLVEDTATRSFSSSVATGSDPQTVSGALNQIKAVLVNQLSREATKQFNLFKGMDTSTYGGMATAAALKSKQGELIKRFVGTVAGAVTNNVLMKKFGIADVEMPGFVVKSNSPGNRPFNEGKEQIWVIAKTAPGFDLGLVDSFFVLAGMGNFWCKGPWAKEEAAPPGMGACEAGLKSGVTVVVGASVKGSKVAEALKKLLGGFDVLQIAPSLKYLTVGIQLAMHNIEIGKHKLPDAVALPPAFGKPKKFFQGFTLSGKWDIPEGVSCGVDPLCLVFKNMKAVVGTPTITATAKNIKLSTAEKWLSDAFAFSGVKAVLAKSGKVDFQLGMKVCLESCARNAQGDAVSPTLRRVLQFTGAIAITPPTDANPATTVDASLAMKGFLQLSTFSVGNLFLGGTFTVGPFVLSGMQVAGTICFGPGCFFEHNNKGYGYWVDKAVHPWTGAAATAYDDGTPTRPAIIGSVAVGFGSGAAAPKFVYAHVEGLTFGNLLACFGSSPELIPGIVAQSGVEYFDFSSSDKPLPADHALTKNLGVAIPQGLHLEGKVNLLGLRSIFKLTMAKTHFEGSFQMDPIGLGGVLTLTRSSSNKKEGPFAKAYMALLPEAAQGQKSEGRWCKSFFCLSAAAYAEVPMLGLKAGAELEISPTQGSIKAINVPSLALPFNMDLHMTWGTDPNTGGKFVEAKVWLRVEDVLNRMRNTVCAFLEIIYKAVFAVIDFAEGYIELLNSFFATTVNPIRDALAEASDGAETAYLAVARPLDNARRKARDELNCDDVTLLLIEEADADANRRLSFRSISAIADDPEVDEVTAAEAAELLKEEARYMGEATDEEKAEYGTPGDEYGQASPPRLFERILGARAEREQRQQQGQQEQKPTIPSFMKEQEEREEQAEEREWSSSATTGNHAPPPPMPAAFVVVVEEARATSSKEAGATKTAEADAVEDSFVVPESFLEQADELAQQVRTRVRRAYTRARNAKRRARLAALKHQMLLRQHLQTEAAAVRAAQYAAVRAGQAGVPQQKTGAEAVAEQLAVAEAEENSSGLTSARGFPTNNSPAILERRLLTRRQSPSTTLDSPDLLQSEAFLELLDQQGARRRTGASSSIRFRRIGRFLRSIGRFVSDTAKAAAKAASTAMKAVAKAAAASVKAVGDRAKMVSQAAKAVASSAAAAANTVASAAAQGVAVARAAAEAAAKAAAEAAAYAKKLANLAACYVIHGLIEYLKVPVRPIYLAKVALAAAAKEIPSKADVEAGVYSRPLLNLVNQIRNLIAEAFGAMYAGMASKEQCASTFVNIFNIAKLYAGIRLGTKSSSMEMEADFTILGKDVSIGFTLPLGCAECIFKQITKTIVSAMLPMVEGIEKAVNAVGDMVEEAFNKIKEPIEEAVDQAKGVIDSVAGLF